MRIQEKTPGKGNPCFPLLCHSIRLVAGFEDTTKKESVFLLLVSFNRYLTRSGGRDQKRRRLRLVRRRVHSPVRATHTHLL